MSKIALVTGGSRGIGFGIADPSILQEVAEIAELQNPLLPLLPPVRILPFAPFAYLV